MSVHHGDPRDFPAGDPFPGCCTCGHATHVGDFPPPCVCFRPALGPPVAKGVDFVLGNHLLQMPVGPKAKRSLADDVDALARRLVEEHPDATHVEYVRNGWRVALARPSDGSAFTVSMVRA